MLDEIAEMWATDRDEVIAWARHLLKGKFLILDTETTGLEDAAIVQIAVINQDGKVLLDTLVKPPFPIPPKATEIHGITNEMVAHAPTFDDVYLSLRDLCDDKHLVIYNADYYWRIIQSYDCFDASEFAVANSGFWPDCAMEHYAAYVGEWNERYVNYRWQKLPGGDHSALGDCKATLAIIQQMALAETTSEKALA